MILADSEILAGNFISPMVRSSPKGVMSFGLSSFGYDIRCSDKFILYKRKFEQWSNKEYFLDPKKQPDDTRVQRVKTKELILPPHGFALTNSIEYFKMPSDVMGIAIGKSTYARCGIVVNITPIEPGWNGYLTVELSNTANVPVKIYAEEGIAQVVFFRGTSNVIMDYQEKGGKYQDQGNEPTLARM